MNLETFNKIIKEGIELYIIPPGTPCPSPECKISKKCAAFGNGFANQPQRVEHL